MQSQSQIRPAVRAVIFDLGGVILRTEDTGPRTALAERLGKTYTELDAIIFGNRVAQLCERGQAAPADVWTEAARLLDLPVAEIPRLRREFFAGDRVDQDLIGMLQGLRSTYRVALLSNTWFIDLPRFVREDLQIPDTFDIIVSSAAEGMAKPDPRIFHLALEKLGVEAGEAVFVDDNLQNIEAASQVGLHTVLFFSPAQLRRDLAMFIRLPDSYSTRER